MRKELLEALKAKFSGVSDTILLRVADRLAKTVKTAEEVAVAVEAVTFQQVLESYGDARATEAQQTAVKNYEQRHNLKDGVKIDKGAADGKPAGNLDQNNDNGGSETVPAWAKSLIDQNREMGERLNKMAAERTTATRRQQLSEVLKDLPESLRKGYERIGVESGSDEEFSAQLTQISAEVKDIVDQTRAKGVVFGAPGAHHGAPDNGELTKEQEAAIAQRDSVPSQGQPF